MANFRPGTQVTSRTAPPPRGQGVETGTWFVVGAAQRGSITSARLINNMGEFRTYYGDRISQSILYDALDTYFREGGTAAQVARVSGPSAATAGITLSDGASGTAIRIDAENPGTWGNGVSVAVTAGTGAGERVIVVSNADGQLDKSPSLATPADALAWGLQTVWVNVSIPNGASGLMPAVSTATAMAGGLDDYAGVTDTIRATALGLFSRGLGAGQVSVPGSVSSQVRTALRQHAKENNRVAFLDLTDTAAASSALTEAAGLAGDEYGAIFGPWVQVPGIIGGTVRQVPPTALAAGLVARSDQTHSPNEAAAGVSNGQARYVIGLTQAAWTDAERDALNTAGVNVFRQLDPVTLYGFRTLAKADTAAAAYTFLNNQRLRLAITDEVEAIAEQFLFQQLDGKGQKVSEFGAALTGVLNRYFISGALYGENADDAYLVDVGPSVNTKSTIANGELHAVLNLKMSPMAEFVVIEIVKTSVSQSL